MKDFKDFVIEVFKRRANQPCKSALAEWQPSFFDLKENENEMIIYDWRRQFIIKSKRCTLATVLSCVIFSQGNTNSMCFSVATFAILPHAGYLVSYQS